MKTLLDGNTNTIALPTCGHFLFIKFEENKSLPSVGFAVFS